MLTCPVYDWFGMILRAGVDGILNLVSHSTPTSKLQLWIGLNRQRSLNQHYNIASDRLGTVVVNSISFCLSFFTTSSHCSIYGRRRICHPCGWGLDDAVSPEDQQSHHPMYHCRSWKVCLKYLSRLVIYSGLHSCNKTSGVVAEMVPVLYGSVKTGYV
jgi:hypothetical protein